MRTQFDTLSVLSSKRYVLVAEAAKAVAKARKVKLTDKLAAKLELDFEWAQKQGMVQVRKSRRHHAPKFRLAVAN